MVFNHIGYIVNDLKKTERAFKNLGYSESTYFKDDNQEIEIMLISGNHSPLIELIKPTKKNHPLKRYNLSGMGANPYHVAFEVENITFKMKELKKKGFVQAMPISEAVAFNNVPFVFLFHHEIGLVELLEIK